MIDTSESPLVIRKNPLVVIDGSEGIPETVRGRVSFRYCPKVFVNTPVVGNQYCRAILVIDSMDRDLLMFYLKDAVFTNVVAVYTMAQIEQGVLINNTIPVISKQMALANTGVEDADIHTLVGVIGGHLGHQEVIVPWNGPSGEASWKLVEYGTTLKTYSKGVFDTYFPYVVWITHVIKKKNYDERRNEIKELNTMLSTTIPIFDKIVLMGDAEYLTQDRFRRDPTRDNPDLVEYVQRGNKDPQFTIGSIISYAWKMFKKNTIVFIARSDITTQQDIRPQLYCRIPMNTMGVLNPVIVPDIPDPRPELFASGSPLVAYGVFYRAKNRPIPENTVLDKVSLYSKGAVPALCAIAKQKKLSIVNSSTNMIARVHSRTTATFTSQDISRLPMCCPKSSNILFAKPVDSRKKVFDIVPDSMKVTIPRLLDINGGTEVKTLMNMTNKYTKRKGGDAFLLSDTEDVPMGPEGAPASVVSAEGCLYYSNHWIHKGSNEGLTYPGGAIASDIGFLITEMPMYTNGCILGINGMSMSSILGGVCTTYLYHQAMGEAANRVQFIVESDEALRKISSPRVNAFARSMKVGCSAISVKNNYVVCGENTYSVQLDKQYRFIGYDPRIVRETNRRLLSEEGFRADVSKHLVILVGDEKWKKSVRAILKKSTTLHVIEEEAATREDYSCASYVIGTYEEDGGWINTLFVNHSLCRVIEISPEFQNDVFWYMYSAAIGCEHAYLALKQEPVKQCKKRIKSHLLAYIRSEDIVSSGESHSTAVPEVS